MLLKVDCLGSAVTPAELKVARAVQAFLSERRDKWFSEYALFPDRRDWSAGRNHLSCLCRLHLRRLSYRGKLLRLFGIDSQPSKNGSILFRWSGKYEKDSPARSPCVLDLLLAERGGRRV